MGGISGCDIPNLRRYLVPRVLGRCQPDRLLIVDFAPKYNKMLLDRCSSTPGWKQACANNGPARASGRFLDQMVLGPDVASHNHCEEIPKLIRPKHDIANHRG